jgi:hypothetical protein
MQQRDQGGTTWEQWNERMTQYRGRFQRYQWYAEQGFNPARGGFRLHGTPEGYNMREEGDWFRRNPPPTAPRRFVAPQSQPGYEHLFPQRRPSTQAGPIRTPIDNRGGFERFISPMPPGYGTYGGGDTLPFVRLPLVDTASVGVRTGLELGFGILELAGEGVSALLRGETIISPGRPAHLPSTEAQPGAPFGTIRNESGGMPRPRNYFDDFDDRWRLSNAPKPPRAPINVNTPEGQATRQHQAEYMSEEMFEEYEGANLD